MMSEWTEYLFLFIGTLYLWVRLICWDLFLVQCWVWGRGQWENSPPLSELRLITVSTSESDWTRTGPLRLFVTQVHQGIHRKGGAKSSKRGCKSSQRHTFHSHTLTSGKHQQSERVDRNPTRRSMEDQFHWAWPGLVPLILILDWTGLDWWCCSCCWSAGGNRKQLMWKKTKYAKDRPQKRKWRRLFGRSSSSPCCRPSTVSLCLRDAQRTVLAWEYVSLCWTHVNCWIFISW